MIFQSEEDDDLWVKNKMLVQINRKLRKKGATIRKSHDCLIAYHGIYYKIPVLHRDRDFSLIEKHTKLKTINT